MAGRHRIASIVIVVAGTILLGGGHVASAPTVASESLSRLKTGNAMFVANPEAPLPIDAPMRRALVQGQAPFAVVLSCADSRVPPEVVFHTGLGQLFVVRAAGIPVKHQFRLAPYRYRRNPRRQPRGTPPYPFTGRRRRGQVFA